MKKLFSLILFTLGCCTVFAAEGSLDVQQILRILESGNNPHPDLSPTHPDSVPLTILQAHQFEGKGDYEKVIRTLEPLREKILYEGVDQVISTTERNLIVGTVGGFAIWRELAYLLLGRAYYKKGWYKEAQTYFSGIPSTSPYYSIAQIELKWALLAIEKNSILTEQIQWNNGPDRQPLHIESVIQKAVSELKNSEYEQTLKTIHPILNHPDFPRLAEELKLIAFYTFAESNYRRWTSLSSQWSYDKKIETLQDVIQVFQKLPIARCDAACSFFIAEVYWNLASTYRIEDPIKNEDKAVLALKKSDAFLTPWVDLSVKNGRAEMPEEAYFLSIAVLMEQGTKQEALAIERLLKFDKFYPLGSYREDVYQILADNFFKNSQFAQAINFYRKLVQTGTAEKATYGMYKVAWSFYNNQQPWKALRHLERLVLSLRERQNQSQSLASVNIAAEARRDLFLILAELMPYREAVKELDIFHYDLAARVEAVASLAESYKTIGKFNDAISLYKQLLVEHQKDPRTYLWLTELLDSQLRAAQRKEIAKTMETYYTALPQTSTAEDTEESSKLEGFFGKLVLTLHREYRKTEDLDIGEAATECYKVFSKFYPNSKQGPVWYHGAQKLEEKEPMASLEWYRKAAEVLEFENAPDAALSVLRILKHQSDQLSLKEKAADLGKSYQTIFEFSQWYLSYLAKYPKSTTLQRHAADYLKFESLFKLGRDQELSDALTELVKQKSLSVEETIKKVKIVYSYYYRAKRWSDIYLLSSRLLQESEVPGLTDYVRLAAQESAFQAGFTQINKNDMRVWYERAIQISPKSDLAIKAWYNLITSYDPKQDAPQIVAAYVNFQKSPVPAAPNSELIELLSNIRLHVAKTYEALSDEEMRAKTLLSSIQLRTPSAETDEISWEAALSFALAGDVDNFVKQVNQLRSNKSPIFHSNPELQLIIPKALLWNHRTEEAWQEWRSLTASSSKLKPNEILLLRSIYLQGRLSENSKATQPVLDWIRKNRNLMSDEPLMIDLWADVDYPEFTDGSLLRQIEFKEIGESASSLSNQDRLTQVKTTLDSFEKQISKINPLIKAKAFQVQLEAICALPKLRFRTLARLKLLQLNPNENPDRLPASDQKALKVFSSKLSEKIISFEQSLDKEAALCRKQSQIATYMKPLCMGALSHCRKASKIDVSDLNSIRSDPAYSTKSTKDKIYSLLSKGAVGFTESLLNSVKDKTEREYLLALIQLDQGDPWTAYQLLKPIVSDPRFGSSAQLLLSIIAKQASNSDELSLYTKKINQNELSDWELKWLQEL